MATLQSLDIRRRSASNEAPPQIRQQALQVAKLIDVSKCIGCKACQAACLEWNDLKWLIRKDGCMHCDDPGCLKACPAPGAIVQYTNGIVDFVSENCIGCGYCVKGCPFNVPRISKVDRKAYKCTLCVDRVAVGQAPACAKACPTQAIYFGSKDDMIGHAEKRIVDLKSRGFKNAGLYNPPGVGGTHVMYVLHHADKPSLYAGLPDDPKISPMVGFWKGVMKPISLAAIAFAGVFGFLHYITKGPNEVSEADQRKGDELAGGKPNSRGHS